MISVDIFIFSSTFSRQGGAATASQSLLHDEPYSSNDLIEAEEQKRQQTLQKLRVTLLGEEAAAKEGRVLQRTNAFF